MYGMALHFAWQYVSRMCILQGGNMSLVQRRSRVHIFQLWTLVLFQVTALSLSIFFCIP